MFATDIVFSTINKIEVGRLIYQSRIGNLVKGTSDSVRLNPASKSITGVFHTHLHRKISEGTAIDELSWADFDLIDTYKIPLVLLGYFQNKKIHLIVWIRKKSTTNTGVIDYEMWFNKNYKTTAVDITKYFKLNEVINMDQKYR